MWKSLKWVVISSEKNWRLQLQFFSELITTQLRDFHMVSPQVAFPYLSTSRKALYLHST